VMCGKVLCNGEWIEGKHEAIVSVEKFEAAQAIRQSRTSYPNRSQQSRYLLSGLLRCGCCGRRLAGHVMVHKKLGKSYLSYIHPHVPKSTENSCRSLAKRVHIVDDAIINQIRELAQSGHMEKVILKDIQSRRMKDHAPKIKERDKILLELAGIDERFMKWAERLDSGKIDERQFEMQNTKLLVHKKQLQERLESIQQEVGDEEQLELSLAAVKSTLKDFPQVWEALEHEERRDVLRLLVESLGIYKDRLELKLLFMEPVAIPLKVHRRGGGT
jgi:site-specific DNA recombinase